MKVVLQVVNKEVDYRKQFYIKLFNFIYVRKEVGGSVFIGGVNYLFKCNLLKEIFFYDSFQYNWVC